tara:strand:+ start:6322 stop:7266 length:945 start_codon:yes stop_codon:yes gene_type:complete
MTIRIVRTRWTDHQHGIRSVRDRVYIQEQQIPASEEWDDAADHAAHYVIALEGDTVIGCIRLFNNGHFGRLAVLPEYRASGIGSQLVGAIKTLAEELGMPALLASAQCSAMNFYWQLGFYNDSNFYLDADIPHLDIALPLSAADLPARYSNAYRAGQDSQLHTLTTPCERLGFLLTQLCQQPATVELALYDPENPDWHHHLLISALVKYLRQGRQRFVRLIIRHDNHIADLPLFTMARRLDSQVAVVINSEVAMTQGVLGRDCWLAEGKSRPGLDNGHFIANTADARSTRTVQQALTECFNSGAPSKELRLRYL